MLCLLTCSVRTQCADKHGKSDCPHRNQPWGTGMQTQRPPPALLRPRAKSSWSQLLNHASRCSPGHLGTLLIVTRPVKPIASSMRAWAAIAGREMTADAQTTIIAFFQGFGAPCSGHHCPLRDPAALKQPSRSLLQAETDFEGSDATEQPSKTRLQAVWIPVLAAWDRIRPYEASMSANQHCKVTSRIDAAAWMSECIGGPVLLGCKSEAAKQSLCPSPHPSIVHDKVAWLLARSALITAWLLTQHCGDLARTGALRRDVMRSFHDHRFTVYRSGPRCSYCQRIRAGHLPLRKAASSMLDPRSAGVPIWVCMASGPSTVGYWNYHSRFA